MEGFYKYENNEWLFAPEKVINNKYELIASKKDSYEYPVDGWSWYASDPRPAKEIATEVQSQLNKRAFGQQLIAEVIVQTGMSDIVSTQPDFVAGIIEMTKPLFDALDAGWLDFAILNIKQVPKEALNEIITAELLLNYRNKIHDYLGVKRVSNYYD